MATVNEKYYISTPIYYVNDKPHIGHAYTTIIADVIARSRRLQAVDVFFLTGTDEHGKKIEQRAQLLGISPQQLVDDLEPSFRFLAESMKCSPSHYIRTTDPEHKKFVQDVWREMRQKGYIYLGKYSGWYAVTDECFYAESDLIDGRAPTGAKVEWMEEEAYFFKLSAFQQSLLEFYAANANFVVPEGRYNEVISFVKRGLHDLCVSRASCSWGIAVPNDSVEGGRQDSIVLQDDVDKNSNESSGKENNNNQANVINFPLEGGKDLSKIESHQVIYVWLDALFNYLSALKIFFPNEGGDHDNFAVKGDKNIFDGGESLFDSGINAAAYSDKPHDKCGNKIMKNAGDSGLFWPCDLHVIGKDILIFHAVYWPAFLMSLDIKPPRQILAHGWWTNEGRKISKSVGNVIDPLSIIEEIPADWLRYFMIKEVPLGLDGNFSHNSMVNCLNADLANNIGNLIQRTANIVVKNNDGLVDVQSLQGINSDDEEILFTAKNLQNNINSLINMYKMHEAIGKIISLSTATNVYIDRESPWKLAKNDKQRMVKVLTIIVVAIMAIGIALQPFMPFYAQKILQIFGIESEIMFTNVGEKNEIIYSIDGEKYESISEILKKFNKIKLPKEPIFPRVIAS